MSEHKVGGEVINGGAMDTLHRLYFFGDCDDGGLPSKDGMQQLRDLGWAKSIQKRAKPNHLTKAGKAVAKEFYEAKAERSLELTQKETFTIEELKQFIDEDTIRWMSTVKPDIRSWLPAGTVFTFHEEEGNPAFVRRAYSATHGENGASIMVHLTTGDRGTDCDVVLDIK